jgi:hypothetical protein
MWQVSYSEWLETRRRIIAIAFGMCQESQEGLKLNGTRQFLAYVDVVTVV